MKRTSPRVAAPQSPPPRPYVTHEDMRNMWAVSRITLWRWIGSDDFPVPFRMGRIVRWRRDEVEAWWERRRSS